MSERLPEELRPAAEAARERLRQVQKQRPAVQAYREYQAMCLYRAERELDGLWGFGDKRPRAWPFGQAARTWSVRASRMIDELTALLASGISAEVKGLPEHAPNPFQIRADDIALSPQQVELYARWVPLARDHLAYLEGVVRTAPQNFRHDPSTVEDFVYLAQRLAELPGWILERAAEAARSPQDYAADSGSERDGRAAENSLAMIDLELSDAELQPVWSALVEKMSAEWAQSFTDALTRAHEHTERDLQLPFEAFSYIFTNRPGHVSSDGHSLRLGGPNDETVFQAPISQVRGRARRLTGGTVVWVDGAKYSLWWKGMFFPKSRATTREFLAFIEAHGGQVG